MACSVRRTAVATFTAIVLTIAAQAGELIRPIPDNAQVTRFTRFNIRYNLRDVIADGVQKVEFYITRDMGGTWELYGEDPDRASPMTIEVEGEGVYGFVSVATDRFGNRERPPVNRTRPETVIIVDRTPPTAKWLSPLQDILGRGQPIEFSWESADDHIAENPVKIQYAVNARSNYDRGAKWLLVQDALPAAGSVKWTPPASGRYNFRLLAEDRAGNVAIAYNPATITVDNTPPAIVSVEPLRSNTLENDIKIVADDGPDGSGVKEFSLYTSDNGAATWRLLKETGAGGESFPIQRAAGETIPFTAKHSGEYPLWPVVFDNAGNASPGPSVAVAGPFILVIDNEPPVVSLSNSFLMGQSAILTNEARRVDWTAYDPHIENHSAAIYLSLDNGKVWQELRSGLPTSGSETITFPFGATSAEAKLKVTVRDEFGNVGESQSDTFRLSGAETNIDKITPLSDAAAAATYDPQSAFERPYPQPTTQGLPDWQTPYPATGSGGVSFPAPVPGESMFPTYTPPSPVYGDPMGQTGGADFFNAAPPVNESHANLIPQGKIPSLQTPTTAIPAPPATPVAPPSVPQQQGGEWLPSPTAGSAKLPEGFPGTEATPTASSGYPVGMPEPAGQLSHGSPALPFPPSGSEASSGRTDEKTPPDDLFTGSQGLPLPQFTEALDTLSDDFPPLASTQTRESAPQTRAASPTSDSAARDAADLSADFPKLPPLDGSFEDLAVPAPATERKSEIAQTPGDSGNRLPPMSGPGGGLELPQPIPTSPSPRPTNPRQLSEHYVKEAREFREQKQILPALDSAAKAVSADDTNPAAYMELSQVNARMEPPDHVAAANLAKKATELNPDWESWWNCADVYYIWSHAANREIQGMLREGQSPPINLVDERNSTLFNAGVAIKNAANVMPGGDREAAKKISNTQGMITYLQALTIPEPVNPGVDSGPAADEYRRQQAAYKAAVVPLLHDAMPYFQNAMNMGGAPEYNETFQLGIINFRLAGLERDTGNAAQASIYYEEAVKYLVEATEARDTPSGGPREAYYMLALSHDKLAEQPGSNRSRNKEQALRYWQRTAEFYAPGTPYHEYAVQRIDALSGEMGL